MHDPVSGLITELKNGSNANKESVTLPHSNFVFSVIKKLAEKGFVKEPSKKGKKIMKYVEVGLIYGANGKPRISGTKRISKPSKRVYKAAKEIHMIKQGFGSTIISTPKGILADDEARKEKVGGEILFNIW